jgi:hypothetical protein
MEVLVRHTCINEDNNSIVNTISVCARMHVYQRKQFTLNHIKEMK